MEWTNIMERIEGFTRIKDGPKVGDIVTIEGRYRKRTWKEFFAGKPKLKELQRNIVVEVR